MALLEYLCDRLDWFTNDDKGELTPELFGLIRVLTRWCGELKYLAPTRSPDSTSPWIKSQQTLLAVLSSVSMTCRDSVEFRRLEAESLGTVLRRACRAVPIDIEPEQLDRDEMIDMELVPFITSRVTSSCDEDVRELLLDALKDASHLFTLTPDDTNVMTAPAVAFDNTERVVKGGLAAACLQSLFTLYASHRVRQLRERVVQAVDDFLATQALLGSIPAPQYRYRNTIS
jgi:hypothetical protein